MCRCKSELELGTFQPLPLRRSGRVRGEGVHLRVDGEAAGSRGDTKNVRFREAALATTNDIADDADDGVDDEAARQLRSICQLHSAINKYTARRPQEIFRDRFTLLYQ